MCIILGKVYCEHKDKRVGSWPVIPACKFVACLPGPFKQSFMWSILEHRAGWLIPTSFSGVGLRSGCVQFGRSQASVSNEEEERRKVANSDGQGGCV